MESLRIKGTDEFPEIVLDKDSSKFKFSGRSIPEDVREFYTPILDWINKYAMSPNENTIVEFKMDYFNTASSKKILDILEVFEKMYEKGNNVFIKWYYNELDDDMEEAGESFFDIVNIPNELIAYN